MSHNPEELQHQLTVLTEAYHRAGLRVNVRKTEVLTKPVEQQGQGNHIPIVINESELNEVDHFTYLGSIISKNGTLDREITNRIQLASSAFGRLKERVFLNTT